MCICAVKKLLTHSLYCEADLLDYRYADLIFRGDNKVVDGRARSRICYLHNRLTIQYSFYHYVYNDIL